MVYNQKTKHIYLLRSVVYICNEEGVWECECNHYSEGESCHAAQSCEEEPLSRLRAVSFRPTLCWKTVKRGEDIPPKQFPQRWVSLLAVNGTFSPVSAAPQR